METEFIYWKHDTSAGIRVEEICGGEDKSQRLWKIMALQVYGENGGDRYREIGHSAIGAPLLEDYDCRISLTHTQHFMAIASLPRTPEANLLQFSLRTAMGIDAERADRAQALKVIERVMNEEEVAKMEEYAAALQQGDEHHRAMEEEEAKVYAAVLCWTCKEALYKAGLREGVDFQKEILIEILPEVCNTPMARNPKYGKGRIMDCDGNCVEMQLFSYASERCIVTLAYSSKCAKFACVA